MKIISANKKDIKEKFLQSKRRVGSGQQGPKISGLSEKIVKRAIRGMLPSHRTGRGREAFKKIRCYVGVPKEFESRKKISAGKEKGYKFIEVGKIQNSL